MFCASLVLLMIARICCSCCILLLVVLLTLIHVVALLLRGISTAKIARRALWISTHHRLLLVRSTTCCGILLLLLLGPLIIIVCSRVTTRSLRNARHTLWILGGRCCPWLLNLTLIYKLVVLLELLYMMAIRLFIILVALFDHSVIIVSCTRKLCLEHLLQLG